MPDKMDDTEYEIKITKAIAQTFHFDYQPSKSQVKCQECGKRFSLYYIGHDVNERMIKHYEIFHNPA